jgi:DNA-binding response OmpR family regulator/HPt (histidine-containing phosphotransfer) domain-containing protein
MKKILIIEDDQLVANIYANKFTVDHFKVEIAPDGDAGFTLVNSFKPDAVLLDLMLPKTSGLDLLKKIRAQAGFETLPVVVFSNTYLSNMVQEAWKAGATKCLSKANCTPKQVIEVIRGLICPPGAGAPAAEAAAPAAAAAPRPASGSQATVPSAISALAAVADADANFQADIRQTFLNSLPASLTAARNYLREIAKNSDENSRVQQLQELYRRVHTLTGNAAIAGLSQISQLADALEALLKELYEKPSTINASTLRTVATAIDFFPTLLDQTRRPGGIVTNAKPEILVVDDEAISRRAITYALEKAKLPCSSLESPEAAIDLLAQRKYDLIFLDVDMPGMNGFELCTKLRSLQRNKNTPVVFVTSLTDFESRANSTMSGGNDLIAKPFIFMELAVKALVYLMRGRLAGN